MKKALFIGLVWPEPTSTAAGSRMLRLIQLFKNSGFQVVFSSAAGISPRSEDLKKLGCETMELTLNDSSFDSFVKELSPDVVVFDRFITEEQFGWRVADHCPDALRILDSEDLHFLRSAREDAIKKDISFDSMNLKTSLAKREIASIYRCDITLVISVFEIELLKREFNLSEELLYYLPFVSDSLTEEQISNLPSFNERIGFMTIGNFRHAPNYDSVRFLKAEVWPEIKKLLPDAQMHVYGAYISETALQWNSPKNDFHLHGAVPDADVVFKEARVCLAPLRFGAGLKGKLLEAMSNGTPSVTTKIGAEGMSGELEWGGFVEDNPKEMAFLAVKLYKSSEEWSNAQLRGFSIHNSLFAQRKYEENLMELISEKMSGLRVHRSNNFIGEMLHFHTLRSTEFMSRWIQEKNKKS